MSNKTIAQIGRRSRFARLGSAVGGSAMGRGGSGILLPPAVYSSLRAPGGYGRTASAVGAHTHAHNALTSLLNDDHTQYLLAPRAKLRIVAPAGAPYTDPKTAIEACAAGDTVLILGGAYTPAAIAFPAGNISVLGANSDGVVLNFTNVGATHCFNLGGHDGIHIADLTANAAAGCTGDIILATNSDDILLERLSLSGVAAYAAILSTASANSHVRDCRLTTGGIRCLILYGVGHRVERNVLTCTNDTILAFMTRGDEGAVVGNTLYLTGAAVAGAAIYADMTGSENCLFADNRIVFTSAAAAARGIDLLAWAGAGLRHEVRNNLVVLVGALGDGIRLETGGAGPSLNDCKLADNMVFNAARGIRLHDANVSFTRVHDNQVVRTNTAAVSDAGTASDLSANT